MSASVPAPSVRPERKRVLGLLDVTLFSVSAILVVDQLTATANIGVSSVGWWILAIVAFFVPTAMITAELATAYPDQGGIYAWVLRAFGRKMAARTTYWYWINVAMWMPSVYLLFTGVLVGLFWSGATLFEQSLVAIGLVWVTVLVGIQTLEVGKKVTGASAALKVAIILTIGIGAIVLAIRHGAANSFAVGQMLPDFGIAKSFLPVIIYQLLGFELVSSMAGEMKDPARHIPRAILLSGIVVATLYVLGTVGMLLALPLAKIGLTEGLVDTFKAIFGGGSIVVWVLAAGAMATYFGNMVTWTLGANKAAAEAAGAGEMPALLAREGKKGTPVWAFLLTGVISTVVLLFAGLFITSQDNLYYALFAASSAIFLLPYLLLFPAVIRLRRIDPGTPRPFRVPGGEPVLWLAVLLAAGSVLAALVLFIWTPGVSIDWSYTGPLLGIVAAAIVGGEIVVYSCFHGMPRTPRLGTSAGDEPVIAATTGGGPR